MHPKVVERNKDIHVGGKSKISIDSDTAIPNYPDARIETGSRRQRRPAAIARSVGVAPGNPGRSPMISWHPHPPVRCHPRPSSIMEDVLAPRIIRRPKPAVFGIFPMAAVKVRTPVRHLRFNRGNPALAIVGDTDPLAVRGQLVLEITQRNVRTNWPLTAS